MADHTAYFCGQWIPVSQVKVDPMDRGFLVGDAVFDFARTFKRNSAFPRLKRSCSPTTSIRRRGIHCIDKPVRSAGDPHGLAKNR